MRSSGGADLRWEFGEGDRGGGGGGGGEREPLMVVEFRDREAAAALSESVAVALRGLVSVTTVDSDPDRPLLLYAWGTPSHASPNAFSSRPPQELDSEMPLFVEDTRPATLDVIDVPMYTQVYILTLLHCYHYIIIHAMYCTY